jgi:hypothetical protein
VTKCTPRLVAERGSSSGAVRDVSVPGTAGIEVAEAERYVREVEATRVNTEMYVQEHSWSVVEVEE